MDGLIGRLIADAGVDRAAAAQAVGIRQFSVSKAPPANSPVLVLRLVGVEGTTPSAVSSTRSSSPHSCGRGLTVAELATSPLQGIAPATTSFAQQIAGDDAAGDMAGAIPGRSA
jgi:hypothetical protein